MGQQKAVPSRPNGSSRRRAVRTKAELPGTLMTCRAFGANKSFERSTPSGLPALSALRRERRRSLDTRRLRLLDFASLCPFSCMSPKRYNISSAYDLADDALAAIRGHYGEQYLEDFVEADSDSFWTRIHKPSKKTVLHTFLANWEYSRWEESYSMMEPSSSFQVISDYLKACGVSLPNWFTPDRADRRRRGVWALIERAFPRAADAAFQLLFQDREFLILFQDLLHRAMLANGPKATSPLASTPIERPTYLPSWLRKGVFFRDRGRCQHCGSDISGLLDLDNILHYDHLLPLHSGGTNEATNFQLLCLNCNLRKGGRRRSVSNVNQSYW